MRGTRLVVICPGCGKPSTLRRGQASTDPGQAARVWVIAPHWPRRAAVRGPDVYCAGSGRRYARSDPSVSEFS